MRLFSNLARNGLFAPLGEWKGPEVRFPRLCEGWLSGESPGFEVGNTTMAVLVAHKSLLEMHTCSYSHVSPSTKDTDDSAGWVYLQHLD